MHMAKCVTEKYEAAKSALTEMLKEPTHIALSTDIWTSIATQAYITVTAHFISSDWELNTFLLLFQKTIMLKISQKKSKRS